MEIGQEAERRSLIIMGDAYSHWVIKLSRGSWCMAYITVGDLDLKLAMCTL